MQKFTYADLTLPTLKTLVHLHERGVVPAHWAAMQAIILPQEQQQIEGITTHLINYRLNLMNEATIWSRAIYPLLLLAETDFIQAWAQVSLQATFAQFGLEGWVDGVLGNAITGTIEAPYFIVVEAKRGMEAKNPQVQLYGTLLAAAWLNQQQRPSEQQEMYGCYTIGDNWTFVHAIVTDIEKDIPNLTVLYSREYSERLEAITILQILKYIVMNRLNLYT